MVSKDNNAFYMAVMLKAPAGSPESSAAYNQITDTVKHATEGSGLTANVTGQAAMVGDLSIIGERDMHMIEIATTVLVLTILLVIYRRPVTVLLPLITIGVSVTAAEGAVSALTHLGMGVSLLTVVLMTTMVAGAGTDYAVFLISRYHECIGEGMDSDAAVQKALSSIGKVIAASAATVAVTFLGMIFARLPFFTSVGPALAVSIAVALLAAITLLPAILVLVGRRGWVAPRRSLTGRLWQRVSHSDCSQTQGASAGQPGGVDLPGRLRGVHSSHVQRPHAAPVVGREQRRLLGDAGPLLDECTAAAVHLHPLTARSADSAVTCGHGPNGPTGVATAQYRCGARYHEA